MSKTLNYAQDICIRGFSAKLFNATSVDRGIFCAPTGTGKTGFSRAIFNMYSKPFFNKEKVARQMLKGVSLFLTPRIALTDQQANAINNFMIKGNHEVIATMVVHSKTNTTNLANTIKNFIIASHLNNEYPVIICTYQSAHHLYHMEFDVIISDEAHNLVGDNDKHDAVIHELDGTAKRVFLTATPKHLAEENSKGFNNTELYGEYMAKVSTAACIDHHLIVPPKMNFVVATGAKDKEQTVVDLVTQVYKSHAEYNPNMPAKVLFAMNGTSDIITVQIHIEEIQRKTGAKVFTIYSKDNGGMGSIGNLSAETRDDFFDSIAAHEGGAIICHYNILAEGMDVDGITGVVFMRIPNQTTTVQTVGRALRPYSLDRMEDGMMNPIKSQRIKKDALISVIVYNGDDDMKTTIGGIVKTLANCGFEKQIEDAVITTTGPGIPDGRQTVVEDLEVFFDPAILIQEALSSYNATTEYGDDVFNEDEEFDGF